MCARVACGTNARVRVCVCTCFGGAACDGLYSISLPVKTFFFCRRFCNPGATLLLPGRVTSLCALVLITIRICEALSLRQPNLVPISHRIQPISIYTCCTDRVAARVFLRSSPVDRSPAWEKNDERCPRVLPRACAAFEKRMLGFRLTINIRRYTYLLKIGIRAADGVTTVECIHRRSVETNQSYPRRRWTVECEKRVEMSCKSTSF